MDCLLCNKKMSFQLTLKDIFSFREIIMPVICAKCKEGFVYWDNRGCAGCGKENTIKNSLLCSDCQTWRKFYGWNLHQRGLYRYNEAMKEYMQRYKFNGDYRLRMVFQYEFSKVVNEQEADLIVPIPVTLGTMQTRGFNQVIGLLWEVPYQPLLRTKTSSKVAQSSKTKEERLTTKQPFILISPEKVINKRVLLVDDVYTTGRTLYHAAVLFKQAGCKEIGSVSLAR
ncbi:ComF family protein [Limosilactobacillus sp. WF-MT5-A]|uniref:ComF family protein n=1 Tax=Limosilactobacillus agrestis TaxID=2759748 RepID=UPI0015FBA149|nr:ComF family protein [Limosilactobacillus agrestis]MBB1099135.1 ComF family protein [Limosilactobacillus agrestis]